MSRAQAESLRRLQELVSTRAQTRASRDDLRARREARLAAPDGSHSAAGA